MAIEQLDLFGNAVTIYTEKEKAEMAKADFAAATKGIKPSAAEDTEAVVVEELQKATEPTASAIEALYNRPVPKEAEKPIATEVFPSVDAKAPVDEVVYSDQQIRVKIKPKATPAPEIEIAEKIEDIAVATPVVIVKRGRKSYKELEVSSDLINIPDDETLQKKLYHGIGEVAEWFGVNTSQIRFWENEFDILQPRKTKKGDRLFRYEDIKNLQLIHHLLRNRKFSIEGAKDYLKANKQHADIHFELTQSLTKFRSFLLELKANLGT
ncbi:MerR family transcriptional regulator [Parasediminibacterium sp. JCM 36343]|uniref:MerR family transcriptional regulator n=1 Tax=Parasediminibacterium sp. JCM 36343 TaxID=3374279 RepID=UPI00397C600C